MAVTNHRLLKFRTISLVISFVFATTVYVNVHDLFMFPLFLLQVVSLMLVIKLKSWNKEKSIRSISRGGVAFLIAVYSLAIAVGVVVSTTTSGVSNSITLLLFYVTCLDALMAIPFVLSFTDKTKWQSSYSGSGFGNDSSVNSANGQAMTGYTDSSGCLPGCGTPSWPAEPYRSNSSNNYDW